MMLTIDGGLAAAWQLGLGRVARVGHEGVWRFFYLFFIF